MHQHDPEENFGQDAAFWDERYLSSPRIWSGQPNPQLVAEVGKMAPGRALDVGCGEGADSLWLAQQGWDVVGVDISGVALERAARHARDADPVVSGRIEWRKADLLTQRPEQESFDLVSVQFMQLPPEPRQQLFAAVAASVRDGGYLLVVGHHPSDLGLGVPRPPMPERFYTSEELVELLDDGWIVLVNEARPRPATTPDGDDLTVHDAVLLARRSAHT